METAASLLAALDRAAASPALQASARGLNLSVRFLCGGEAVDFAISDGRMVPTASAGQADISIAAEAGEWAKVIASPPPPRYNSFTALQIKNDAFDVSGDPLVIAQARAALEDIFEAIRPSVDVTPAPAVARDISLISGRYASVTINGQSSDIYYETSGDGIPVVMLHTAGSDSRQFRNLLTDVEMAKRWRMIAFDMPFHGRSFPRDDYHGEPYKLAQQAYADAVIAFLEQVAGERVILTGCSMGAAITLVVASQRPDLLRGVIALEPPLRSPGRLNPYLTDARVANGIHNSTYVRGLMSPSSPALHRKRAEWIYAQGGPGIYAGDLSFYSDEFDGHVIGPKIDGNKLPVHLLTGEYDYSATIEDGRKLAALIPGAKFEAMNQLGHFPMTEHPDLFRTYFLPALQAMG